VPGYAATVILIVFFAGIGSMATEICASRLLAPFYGSSTVVWANIIGLVLASLSLGYWLGGKLADRHPSPVLLGRLVLAGAALVALIPFVAGPLLEVSVRGIDTVSVGAVLGSFAASLALFAPPVVLLGMVTPFAIRLGVTDVAAGGSFAGKVFALSTLGSLLGTFVPALVTIPLIGTQRTLIGAAVVIAAGAVPVLGLRWAPVPVALAALLLVPPGVVKPSPASCTRRIALPVHPGRASATASGSSTSTRARQSLGLAPGRSPDGGEWDVFSPRRRCSAASREVAVWQRAAGRRHAPSASTIRGRGSTASRSTTPSARRPRYFGLGDNPRLCTARASVLADSRADPHPHRRLPRPPCPSLRRRSSSVSAQRLAPGIIALNVSTVPGDDRLADAIAGTLADVFPQVVTWQALPFNQFVVGLNAPRGET
jgi:hypothetical protein